MKGTTKAAADAPGENSLLTVAETAVALRVSKSTICRYAKRGEMRHMRKGRVLRFERSAVEEFKRRHRQGL